MLYVLSCLTKYSAVLFIFDIQLGGFNFQFVCNSVSFKCLVTLNVYCKQATKMRARLVITFSLISTTLSQKCVQLSDCPPILEIWSNRTNLVFMSSRDALVLLRGSYCGFANSEPKVYCDVDHYDFENPTATLENGRTALVDKPLKGCKGTLYIYTFPRHKEDFKLSRTHVIRGNVQRFRARFFLRRIYGVINTGNCCWSLHSKPSFQTRSTDDREHIHLGFSGRSQLSTAKSVQKVPCVMHA